jgi:gluconate kinase
MDNQNNLVFAYFIRGVSGSGKSTLAESLKTAAKATVVEADQFFLTPTGEYAFDPKKLPQAHQWARNKMKQALSSNQNVIVPNTFIKLWELKGYLNDIPDIDNLVVVIIELNKTGTREQYKNIHGLPDAKIQQQTSNFEPYSNQYGEDLGNKVPVGNKLIPVPDAHCIVIPPEGTSFLPKKENMFESTTILRMKQLANLL